MWHFAFRASILENGEAKMGLSEVNSSTLLPLVEAAIWAIQEGKPINPLHLHFWNGVVFYFIAAKGVIAARAVRFPSQLYPMLALALLIWTSLTMIKNQMPDTHLCSTQGIHHSCSPMLGVKRNQMKDTCTVVNFHCGAFHLPVILSSNLHITIKLHTIYGTQ